VCFWWDDVTATVVVEKGVISNTYPHSGLMCVEHLERAPRPRGAQDVELTRERRLRLTYNVYKGTRGIL
jgi:hypothetical protein